jgi:hypothetical protein
MTESRTAEEIPEVPEQIFKKFLVALENAGLSVELIARLRKTLLEDKLFTERALREAVLTDERLP